MRADPGGLCDNILDPSEDQRFIGLADSGAESPVGPDQNLVKICLRLCGEDVTEAHAFWASEIVAARSPRVRM